MVELESEIKAGKGPRLGIRHVQVALLFLNIAIIYIGRNNISVAVVAMMNAATTNPDFPEFDWTEKEKNYIISSFAWGYIMLTFAAGYLNRRLGAKTLLLACTFSTAITNLLTPYLVTLGSWQVYTAIRVMQGIFQGVLFPCIHDHIAKWSPKDERYLLGALTYTGIILGNFFALYLNGLIASSAWGWPGISYVSGALCIAWCILWVIFGSRNPPSSRFITKEECEYIEQSMNHENDFHKKRIPLPWFAMLTSVPFWMMIVARCTDLWCFFTIQTQIPSYLNGVMNMSMKSNALYSSLPYLAGWIMSYVYLIMGMVIVRRGWLRITTIRKTANTLATWVPAVVLIIIGFLDDTNEALVVSLFVVAVGAETGAGIGCHLVAIDLSPNHASIVMGIANTFACIINLIVPLVAGFTVTDVHDRSEWQILFGIAALIAFFGNLFYIIFGSSEAQPWDAPDFLERCNDKPPQEVDAPSYLQRGNAKQPSNIE